MTPDEIQELQKCSQVLAAALAAENVSFTTYALMAVISEAEEKPTLAGISRDINASYHTLFKVIERSNFFQKDYSGPLITLALSADGSAKMERIQRRLTHHKRHESQPV